MNIQSIPSFSFNKTLYQILCHARYDFCSPLGCSLVGGLILVLIYIVSLAVMTGHIYDGDCVLQKSEMEGILAVVEIIFGTKL